MKEIDPQYSVRAHLLDAHRRFVERNSPVSREEHPVLWFLCLASTYVQIALALYGLTLATGEGESTIFGVSFIQVFCLYSIGCAVLYVVIGLMYPKGRTERP